MKSLSELPENTENLEPLKEASNSIENIESRLENNEIKIKEVPDKIKEIEGITNNLNSTYLQGTELDGMANNLLERAADIKEKLEQSLDVANSPIDGTRNYHRGEINKKFN